MRNFLICLFIIFSSACQAESGEPHADIQDGLSSELFLRIIKTSPGRPKGYLEAWRRGADGKFALDRTFDICTWSGALGPKLKEGDGQSPEGFYFVRPGAMNPNSSYHLSFNLGFPNAFDRAHGRTGSCLLYTSPSPRDGLLSRMPSSA